MPQIKIKSSAGSANIHYTIATPKNPSAKAIDKGLPTIIFIHPVYIASHIFELQFSDSHLRQFNLVALDLRAHGETTGKVGAEYGREQAADDIKEFMKELRLPPCHFVGVSMGACISWQFAISFPEKALSVTMISPLPLTEPPAVAEGREEIYDCWIGGFDKKGIVDEDALNVSVQGAIQLGFSGRKSSLIEALVKRAYPQAIKNWGPKNLVEYRIATLDFFTKREAQAPENVRKIKCPIKLLHCGADVAYDEESTHEVLKLMQDNGVNAELLVIEGADHFGNVSNPLQVNEEIYRNVTGLKDCVLEREPLVVSPFTAILKKLGYEDDAD
ncbi:Alpha/Beta hydrolase protein, partial [Mycena sanguinolenta]